MTGEGSFGRERSGGGTAAKRALIRRKRRHAAHEILFFLGVVRKSGWSFFDRYADEELPFTYDQIQARIRSIAAGAENAEGTKDAEETAWDALVASAKTSPRDPGTEPREWVAAVWKATAGYLYASKYASRGRTGRSLFVSVFANLAALLAIFGSIYLAIHVDQVEALFRNADRSAQILVPLLVLFPPLLVKLWACYTASRGGGRILFVDAGRPTVPFWRAQPHPPSSHVDRFAPGSKRARRIYWAAPLARAIVWGPGLILAAICTASIYDGPANTTAFLALAMLVTLIAAGGVVDHWDFVSPVKVRLSILVLVGCIVRAVLQSNAWILVGGTLVVALWHVFFPRLRHLYIRLDRWYHSWRHPKEADLPEVAPPESLLVSHRRPEHTGRGLVVCVALCPLIFTLVNIPATRDETWKDRSQPIARLQDSEWPMKGRDPVVVMAASGGGSRAAIVTALTLQKLHAAHSNIACQIQAISSVSGGSLTNAVYVHLRMNEETDPCPGPAPEGDWLLDLVDDDFIRPTMEGALWPFKSRGKFVEEAFARTSDGRPRTGTETLAKIRDAWRARSMQPGKPPLPVPLFNTTRTDGHDLVISPLSRQAYIDTEMRHRAKIENSYDQLPAGEPTWVFYREAIYGLEELLPSRDVTLAEAVRASANFPFGFPPIRIETNRPSVYSPDGNQRHGKDRYTVAVTDGGVLSNSGMWSLFQLLKNKVKELKDRGVLLLIIDANRMPGVTDNPTILDAYGDQVPIAANLHRRMIDVLKELYGSRLIVVEIALPPLQSHNVMTSWVLTKTQIGKLRTDVGDVWTKAEKRINAGWRRLHNGENQAPAKPAPELLRLPTD